MRQVSTLAAAPAAHRLGIRIKYCTYSAIAGGCAHSARFLRSFVCPSAPQHPPSFWCVLPPRCRHPQGDCNMCFWPQASARPPHHQQRRPRPDRKPSAVNSHSLPTASAPVFSYFPAPSHGETSAHGSCLFSRSTRHLLPSQEGRRILFRPRVSQAHPRHSDADPGTLVLPGPLSAFGHPPRPPYPGPSITPARPVFPLS